MKTLKKYYVCQYLNFFTNEMEYITDLYGSGAQLPPNAKNIQTVHAINEAAAIDIYKFNEKANAGKDKYGNIIKD